MIDRKTPRTKRSKRRSTLASWEASDQMMAEMMSEATTTKISRRERKRNMLESYAKMMGKSMPEESPRRHKTESKKKNRPFALFPRDFIFTPGNPLIPLNQGQLNSKTAEKTRDRILREYIKQFRADGLHWLLLCHLRALTGKSNPVYISCTALARRLSSSGKADGRWLQLTKDALLALEAAELISLEDQHKKRMIITIPPIVINEGKHGYIKVYLSSANKLRLNACLAFCFLLKCQPAKRIINGWYLTTIAKKIGLSYGHDRSRMRQWLRKHLSIINKEILGETHKNYKMEIKGRPAKVYIELT